MKMELDKLSNLPSEIIDQILYKMPIKEAVTCVLSSEWRYKWAMLSHLVFDEQCDSTLDHSTFVNIVDRILLLHIGPIHKFKLSHHKLVATSDIDRWILYLSRNSIKEFILDVRFLVVAGVFKDVILKNTSNLVDVTICLNYNDQGRFLSSSSNLLKFFAYLPQIQRLILENNFLKYLAVGNLRTKLPIPCLYLKFLSIHICLADLEEFLTVLCLMKSSPALQELKLVSIRDDDAVAGEVNSWLDDNRSCQFSQLRLVKIFGLRGVIAELEFIRFVLLRSPILQSMTVKPRSDDGSSELLKKWLRFKRVSVDAEIIYLDP